MVDALKEYIPATAAGRKLEADPVRLKIHHWHRKPLQRHWAGIMCRQMGHKKCRLYLLGLSSASKLVVDHQALVSFLDNQTLDAVGNPRLEWRNIPNADYYRRTVHTCVLFRRNQEQYNKGFKEKNKFRRGC